MCAVTSCVAGTSERGHTYKSQKMGAVSHSPSFARAALAPAPTRLLLWLVLSSSAMHPRAVSHVPFQPLPLQSLQLLVGEINNRWLESAGAAPPSFQAALHDKDPRCALNSEGVIALPGIFLMFCAPESAHGHQTTVQPTAFLRTPQAVSPSGHPSSEHPEASDGR